MVSKVMKCAILVLLSFSLLIANKALAHSKPLELTVADAEQLALEGNLEFQLVLLELKQAQAAQERAEIVGDEEMLVEAAKMLAKATNRYEEEKQNYSNRVHSFYQELLESETSLANWERAKKRAEEQLKIDRSKYEAGLLSTLDIQRAENSLLNAETSYQNALISLKTKKMEFNQLLGLDLQAEVFLVERLVLDFVPFDLELDFCYTAALQTDSTILQAVAELEQTREKVQLAQNPFVPRIELENALAAEKKAEIRVIQAEQALYFQIRGDYFDLINRIQRLEAKEREINLETKTLQAEESKYAAGVLSNAQIVAQQEKLAQLEQEYSTELLQYSLARLKFLQTIGLAGVEMNEK